MWRPKEGWSNPYKNTMDVDGWIAFESGADALLEALRKSGQKMPKGATLKSFFDVPILENGTLVFIPDEVEDENSTTT